MPFSYKQAKYINVINSVNSVTFQQLKSICLKERCFLLNSRSKVSKMRFIFCIAQVTRLSKAKQILKPIKQEIDLVP